MLVTTVEIQDRSKRKKHGRFLYLYFIITLIMFTSFIKMEQMFVVFKVDSFHSA